MNLNFKTLDSIGFSKEQQKLIINKFDDNSKTILDNLIAIYEKFSSKQNIYLPVEPYQFLWHVSPCRVIMSDAAIYPSNCTRVFSEQCEQCEHYKKDCVDSAIALEKWFFIGSSDLPNVVNNYGTYVFDNEEDCINACIKEYGKDSVDKCEKEHHECTKNYEIESNDNCENETE